MKLGIIVWSIIILTLTIASLGWGSLIAVAGAVGVFYQTFNSPKI